MLINTESGKKYILILSNEDINKLIYSTPGKGHNLDGILVDEGCYENFINSTVYSALFSCVKNGGKGIIKI